MMEYIVNGELPHCWNLMHCGTRYPKSKCTDTRMLKQTFRDGDVITFEFLMHSTFVFTSVSTSRKRYENMTGPGIENHY